MTTIALTNSWQKIADIYDGKTYGIQNTGEWECEYIYSTSEPSTDTEGGVLCAKEQMFFKYVAKDLYMRENMPNSNIKVFVEEIEEA